MHANRGHRTRQTVPQGLGCGVWGSLYPCQFPPLARTTVKALQMTDAEPPIVPRMVLFVAPPKDTSSKGMHRRGPDSCITVTRRREGQKVAGQ